jgi:hypothetical protein
MRVAKGATGANVFKPSQALLARSCRQQHGKNLQKFHFGHGYWPSSAANFTLDPPSKVFIQCQAAAPVLPNSPRFTQSHIPMPKN